MDAKPLLGERTIRKFLPYGMLLLQDDGRLELEAQHKVRDWLYNDTRTLQRGNFLIVIVSMAIDSYGMVEGGTYDHAAKAITAATERCGLAVAEETVRDDLRRGRLILRDDDRWSDDWVGE